MNPTALFHKVVSLVTSRWVWIFGVEAVLLFGLGYLVHATRSTTGDSPKPKAKPSHSAATSTLWTCAMHPQIQKTGPGKCPLCPMELVQVIVEGENLTGLRQIVFSPEAVALMQIDVSPVERKFVSVAVRMVGKVDFDETRMKHITAWVDGRLDELYVNYTGVPVKKGDHLVYIYSPDLYVAQQELIDALRSARERRPGSRLFQPGGIDPVESSREKLRLWGMTPAQIRKIEQRDKPSDHMTIFSPIEGIVIEKLKQQGDYVKTGERIYTVADLSQVWIKLDAYESDLTWLRYGQQVTFTSDAYPGEKFTGRIAFIDPVLNQKTRTVKVRVNVPNLKGKLKPGMFVHGIVNAQIAGKGRVLDVDLAGKWISPMHPEIIKDAPGKCDICGMPLVTAESLGYVSAEGRLTPKPLVIPASAVLRTGTRAIVYVKLPDAKQPTFEGREIVLGPRAGSFYQVRSGLREGELVVTNGNFKIDSALQIQAKPSMMTPEGGGGGMHMHDHGGEKPKQSGKKSASAMQMKIPAAFGAQLKGIEAAYQSAKRAVEAEDLARIRSAFQLLGEALGNVDSDLLSGHPAMLWKEFRMLLVNDAVEGSDVENLDEAQRVFAGLTRTIQRVRNQLPTSHAGHVHQ